jgi:hypothetical protein
MNDGTITHFLNVDLDIHLSAQKDLEDLARAFEPGASALHCDGHFANLELLGQPTDAESAIRRFAGLIKKLPPKARALWKKASKRDFSIGVEAGIKPSSFELALTPAVLKLAAEVGARITFVVYVNEAVSRSKASRGGPARAAAKKPRR